MMEASIETTLELMGIVAAGGEETDTSTVRAGARGVERGIVC